ncbi:CP family cyanate transporter-like MFS transporter [Xenorhabdus cabanillasii]|uniref:CP family cyanate transporter-like MFS transporter n=1 Tax=Xenorhabdus cabanillasii TaxID=351673 RepID=A0A3D9URK3_9GAMM|nr:cyanate transporter [Xenorhabdus cabanillasii]REF28604.1 CP family cyanate transporter-like MFS transporter [Xenorhabdus cabanillasii]
MLKKKSNKSDVLILLSLILIGLNLRPSMAAIGPILSAIRADIPLSFTMVSLLTMLPVFSMGLAMFVGIRLGNKVGENRLIAYSLLLIAGATSYRYYAQDPVNLLFTAIIAGMGIALIQALVPKIIKSRFSHSIELFMGVYVTAIMGGAALAASASPYLAECSNNWRFALSIWGGLAILALVSWFIVKKYLGNSKKGFSNKSTFTFHKNPRAWLLGVFFGLGTSAYTCVLAWLPPYYFDLGWQNKESGFILAFLTSVEVVSGIVIPAIASRNKDRRIILIFLLSCIIVGFSGLIAQPEQYALLWASFLGLGIGGLFPMSLIVTIDHIEDPEQAGKLTAFVQGIGYMIAAMSPLVAGYIKDSSSSFTTAWLILAVIAGLMIFMVQRFKPTDYEIHFQKVTA